MSERAEPPWGGDDEPEAPQEPDYRRRRQPVRVRRSRGADWGGRAQRAWQWGRTRGWKPALIAALVLGTAWGADTLLLHGPEFVLAGSDQIVVKGAVHTDPARVRQCFAADLGRDVFYIPLRERQQAIDALPWVRQAAVLRVWPAAIQVRIEERVPVAFARAGSGLVLLDASGVALPAAGGSTAYNFPVLVGVPGVSAASPNTPARLAARQPAMKLYAAFRQAVARTGGTAAPSISGDISEIDLSHADDLVATVADPGAGGATTLVHLGDQNLATRLSVFFSQIATWRQKYPNMTSVDLHVDGEAIVDPGTAPAAAPAPPTAAPASAHRAHRP